MDWEAIGAVGEVVGAIAVFGTLIYLAIQIRIQNEQLALQNKESRLAGNQQLFDSIREVTQSLYSDPGLIQVYRNSYTKEMRSFDSEDAIRLSLVYQNQLRVWECAYYQYIDNRIDERLWPSLERAMCAMLASSAFKDWWPTRAMYFSVDFVNYVNSIEEPKAAEFLDME